jgi:hypothetical protein
MLRPWVPLIALALLMAIGWHTGILAVVGGVLLGLALGSQLLAWTVPGSRGLAEAWRKRKTQRRMARLDWAVIDNSMAAPRPRQDCERPETLGICTGLECMVYKTCNFNIKKPLP